MFEFIVQESYEAFSYLQITEVEKPKDKLDDKQLEKVAERAPVKNLLADIPVDSDDDMDEVLFDND